MITKTEAVRNWNHASGSLAGNYAIKRMTWVVMPCVWGDSNFS